MDIKIVIAVNKNDVWFCRICIASIRYYYPSVKIYLIKDELNGKFSTNEIEKFWNVELIDYPMKKFGWSAAKIHFYTDERFLNQNFLVLDSDIVLIGKLLDEPYIKNFESDVTVSEELVDDPNEKWFGETYFNYSVVQRYDPDFVYPGYSFNCGQIFCKGNFLSKEQLETYFDFNNFPSWKRLDIFPLVDQSLFNYLLPSLSSKRVLSLERKNFMIWSESEFAKKISLSTVKKLNGYPGLIHWAGAMRSPLLIKMSHTEILKFFEDYYYSIIPNGNFLKIVRKVNPQIIFISRYMYSKAKKIFKILPL